MYKVYASRCSDDGLEEKKKNRGKNDVFIT